MEAILNLYNSQIPVLPSLFQLHTDRHSDQDTDSFSGGGHTHSEHDSHTDSMWGDGEEE